MKNTIWPERYTAVREKSATSAATVKAQYCSSARSDSLKPRIDVAKTITLIVDNYIIYKSHKTRRWLKANPKCRVIYQPIYSPWVNQAERLWQALNDTITRNHQCRSMRQMLKKVRHFMKTVSPFPGGEYRLAKM